MQADPTTESTTPPNEQPVTEQKDEGQSAPNDGQPAAIVNPPTENPPTQAPSTEVPDLKEATLPPVSGSATSPAVNTPEPVAVQSEKAVFNLKGHIESARQVGKLIFDLLAGENPGLTPRFDQEPNYTHLPLERTGGIALQMSEGMPYRILTAAGAIPIFRGFPKKFDPAALTEKLGLETMLPRALLPAGSFGPIYEVTLLPDGSMAGRAELRRGSISSEQSSGWQTEFRAAMKV